MARMNRMIVPGYVYHITQRGNNKTVVFYDDKDRRVYCDYINKEARKWGMLVLAFCLMNNHVHYIVVAQEEHSISKAIGIAHMRYTRYFNVKMNQIGHLWHSRFYSKELSKKNFFNAIRYVENNPVKAQYVNQASDWVWSSAREHLGLDASPINLESVYDYLEVNDWRYYLNESG